MIQRGLICRCLLLWRQSFVASVVAALRVVVVDFSLVPTRQYRKLTVIDWLASFAFALPHQ